MVYPIAKPIEVNYQPDDFQQLMINDFAGGLNVTDPTVTLPPNQFTAMLNFYYNRQATIHARFPFRPVVFSTTVQDKYVLVDISGDDYRPVTIHDYQVFRESLSDGWSYNDEVHVVTGIFEDVAGVAGDRYVVAVYNSSSEEWVDIWSALSSSTTSVSVVSYKINKAFDLIIFPNNTNPERWTPDASPGTLSDLGLIKPVDIHYTITGITKANPAVVTVTEDASSLSAGDHILIYDVAEDSDYNREWEVASVSGTGPTQITMTESSAAYAIAGTTGLMGTLGILEVDAAAPEIQGVNKNGIYTYTFAYFYDDANATTRFGLSPCGMNHDITVSDITAINNGARITIHPFSVLPSGVTKIYVYRSPPNVAEGPYKQVGIITDLDSDWYDTTFVGEEGIECLPDGTNPSLSGSELSVVNVSTVGARIIGFDASMPHKLIWSDSGSPDVWNPLSFDYLDNTGIKAIEFNRAIYIFTTESCYQRTSMSEGSAIKISNIGSIDGRSIQDVGNGLVWMDYDTIYFADFVQQYGSKGDFPLDIGHQISKSVRRRDTSAIVNSAFFERRYYVTYTDTEDFILRTYVYDVDIRGWIEHSAKHLAWSIGDKTLFSLGSNNGKYYVYEHDYFATVAEEDNRSTYSGKDYHDYASVVQPIARWTMDDNEADTIVIDSMGLSEGTLVGGSNTEDINSIGQIDGALKLDGDDDYIDSGAAFESTFQSDFSISFWFKVDDGQPGIRKYITAVLDDTGSDSVVEIFIEPDGSIVFRYISEDNSGNDAATAAGVLSDGQETWHHLLCVADSTINGVGGKKIYLDGVLQELSIDGSTLDVVFEDFTSVQNLYIGTRNNGGSPQGDAKYFSGDIDEVMIFNEAVSAGGATELYNEKSAYYAGMTNITTSIGRDNIKIGGDFRKVFVSSLSIEAEGSVISIEAFVSGQDNAFSTSKVFSSGSNADVITQYAFVFDESVFAVGSIPTPTDAGDAEEAGFAGFSSVSAAMHKKINRVIKSNAIGITLTSVDSRGLNILYIVLYWKSYSSVA